MELVELVGNRGNQASESSSEQDDEEDIDRRAPKRRKSVTWLDKGGASNTVVASVHEMFSPYEYDRTPQLPEHILRRSKQHEQNVMLCICVLLLFILAVFGIIMVLISLKLL
eukprot:TRINITY_DN5968_c0_g1_i1.p1 TRINITY_DN5968_c0_g1~~TRINITY_DN5968_c0_g1_i1.p1  ORF type:complete len:112 (+),score=10.13 TRINITY_DN5968_c0_g1_i1:77-412(+)